uniref:T1SS secreted agglutinin RTX n=1 Tax=uncultured Thiotrichaceae bacterium TaxID=298394 RepID=A0A6S6SN10_9GAMM|nr:MAG: T1SS secreted agglutinin RTX [uncultured Thiotrichaceae bacterium]
MNKNKGLSYQWILFPILFSSASVLAGGFGGLGSASVNEQASALSAETDGFLDDSEEVSAARMNYVGGDTRIGVGIDTEFKGRIDGSHIFMQTEDSVTSGQGWLGVNPGADDKLDEEILTGAGAKINHHWVTRDSEGNPLHVNKVFGAYDQNEARDKKISAGYGQERENFFWSGQVSKGLSDRRLVDYVKGGDNADAYIYEKAYDFGVGGRVGTFFDDQLLRVQGGLDYEWGTETADHEDTANQLTVSGGLEKFFYNSPHSIGANVEISKQSGGYEYGDEETDVSGNVSYRYDFGGAGLFAGEEQYRRVRVEIPGKTERVQVKKKRAPVKKKRAPKVERKLVKHTMELESDTFFERGKYNLTPQAKKRMSVMMSRIRETGHHGNIRITGNTCDLGSDHANQTLSERRAAQVRSFMAANGFNANELVARGLGESSPKYANNEATRHRNRRVDIEYVAYQSKYEDKVVEQGYDVVEQGYDVEEQVRVVSEPRVVWRKELIPSPPTWVGQALRNNIQYKQTIDTYRTLGEDFVPATPDKPDNRLPVATDDHSTTKVDSAVSISVLGNDTDPDGDVLTISSIDEQSVNDGSVAENESGILTYTPAHGFTGTDTFTYTVNDGHGGEAIATVTVVVEADPVDPVNSSPVAVDDSVSTTIDKQVPIHVLGNDTDADSDVLVISSFDVTTKEGGTVASSDGQLLYTPAAGFVGEDTFTYTISDNKGGLATATVSVTVTDDSAPIPDLDAQNDSGTTPVNTPVEVDVISNDSDPDGDTVSIDRFDSNSKEGGTIAENANGSLVYTPPTDFTGTDSFTYDATDGNGETDTATVIITVGGGIDPKPHNKPAPDTYTVAAGQSALSVLSNDTYDEPVTIRIITHPGKGSITNESNGDVSGADVVYVPQAGATGTDTFTYALVDDDGLVSDPVTVTITLPVSGGVDAIDDGTAGEVAGDTYSFYVGDTVTRELGVLSNDLGNGLQIVEIVSGPRFGTAHISADGQSVNYTLRHGYCEDHSFVYRIRDENGNEDDATVYINIMDGKTCTSC